MSVYAWSSFFEPRLNPYRPRAQPHPSCPSSIITPTLASYHLPYAFHLVLHSSSSHPTFSLPCLGMAEEARPRQLREYYTPSNFINPSPIVLPNVTAAHYEIRPNVLQALPSFYGLANENPYDHIKRFLGICSMTRIQHFADEALRLTLFPFSLHR